MSPRYFTENVYTVMTYRPIQQTYLRFFEHSADMAVAEARQVVVGTAIILAPLLNELRVLIMQPIFRGKGRLRL